MLFVSLFLIVNIIAQKIVPIGHVILTAADFIYPLNYALSIILTEVYGYAMSRRIIWLSFGCNFVVVLIIMFSITLPAASTWQFQEQYTILFGRTFVAFLVGEFIGTYILAKLKIATFGKHLWFRTFSATSIGQLIDSAIFTLIAFVNLMNWHDMIVLTISAYVFKIIYQIIITPGVYALADFLKKHEQIDIFDQNTNFNPFNLRLK
jgi:uncharacterized integral membrane protein (TIGR00697 family)